MNRQRLLFVKSAMLAAAVASLAGCNTAATKSGSEAAPSASGMTATGMSLVNQLGGMSMVTRLADAFGANLTASPILSKLLDAGAITQAKQGLENEIAKASGLAEPNPGVDMLATLSGRGIGADGVDALTAALSSAADTMKLGAPQKAAVMAMFTPITDELLDK